MLKLLIYVPACSDVVQNRELQIMRKLDHDNIVTLRYFFYSSGDKVTLSVTHDAVDIVEGYRLQQLLPNQLSFS